QPRTSSHFVLGAGCRGAAHEPPAVTKQSPSAAKIALFRRLFSGRGDVFPVRWENTRTGKSGYAPACTNEWKPGVCQKPRVKCGECPHQAFVPVSNEVGRDGARQVASRRIMLDDTIKHDFLCQPDSAELADDVNIRTGASPWLGSNRNRSG